MPEYQKRHHEDVAAVLRSASTSDILMKYELSQEATAGVLLCFGCTVNGFVQLFYADDPHFDERWFLEEMGVHREALDKWTSVQLEATTEEE